MRMVESSAISPVAEAQWVYWASCVVVLSVLAVVIESRLFGPATMIARASGGT